MHPTMTATRKTGTLTMAFFIGLVIWLTVEGFGSFVGVGLDAEPHEAVQLVD